MDTGRVARTTLAGIRIFNGAVGLFAARRMAQQLGGELGDDKRFVYPARMFGIRTIVLGVDLLTLRANDPGARRVLTQAVLIHATDTASAAYAGWRGEVPAKAAKFTTAVSAVNTVLAVLALASHLRGNAEPA